MTIRIATQTLKAIEEIMVADQGGAFRQWQGKVFPHIGDAYREADDGLRSHLGASMIGKDCARSLWYTFHWAIVPQFKAQTLRLFNRGHLEEARFIALLLMIGCKVYQQDAEGKQYRITHANGHVGGSCDGLALGIPDLPPGTWCLLEFKTHGEKSFLELKKKGMKESKRDHYIQMQTYMRKMGITCGLYMAVNKNTDEIYAEIILLDSATADQYLDRGEKIVYLEKAPQGVSNTPGYFGCMWCEHKGICHLGAPVAFNCRTCVFASPNKTDSNWRCSKFHVDLDRNAQAKGCTSYVFDQANFSK